MKVLADGAEASSERSGWWIRATILTQHPPGAMEPGGRGLPTCELEGVVTFGAQAAFLWDTPIPYSPLEAPSLSGYKGDGLLHREGSRRLWDRSDEVIRGLVQATVGLFGNI